MPDYIVRQTPAANVTVISGQNQIIIQQSQPFTVCLSTGGTSYTLPIATNATLGGIKVGANLTVDANGVLASTGGMTLISNVTYGVSQIPNILGNNNARYLAGMRASQTVAAPGNNTIVKESYSGLAYSLATSTSVGHVAGFTDTYSDPAQLFNKQQFEVRAASMHYSATNQANVTVFSAGFSVQSSGGSSLFFYNYIDDVSTQMQVDGDGVTMYTNGKVTVNSDEVVTLEVAKTLFAPLTFIEPGNGT